MAHSIIEALYIGLFAAGSVQPLSAPVAPVITDADGIAYVDASPRTPRVVYDWASGRRTVYRAATVTLDPEAPQVGITEAQIQRMTQLAAS